MSSFRKLPKLVRLFLVHGFVGLCLGGLFTGLLIWMNIANLGHLILTSSIGWLAIVMLVWFSAITFGGVQIAIRVMSMAEDDAGTTGGRPERTPSAMPPRPVPVPVHATHSRGRGNR